MQGLHVTQVLLLFSFTYRQISYPCAIVKWFVPAADEPCDQTGMWLQKPDLNLDGQRVISVIHLDSVMRAAHLIGVYGIPFIELGDFRQVAPIVPNGGPHAILQASIKSSFLWPVMHILRLTTPICTAHDPEYTALIDTISEDFTHNKVSVSFLTATTSIDDCIDFLYPSHILPDATLCLNRAFLSPLHADVDNFNSVVLAAHLGDDMLYYSSNALQESDTVDALELLPDYFAQLKHAGVPDQELALKVGSICTIE
ncbi:hypothetical protein EW146_g10514 [Bondarzewia mesenterica]|uniref:ATP-dependent DNA helicase n=1 Tax=Bondarzewia mesenterica TaxID=1095465 RepID=A0A4S4KW85_9AGAM|nr:hypothetical protein EW146_g10514 [Bondarzewia mesenterica]